MGETGQQKRKSQVPMVVGAVLLIIVVTVIYMMELNQVVSENINGTISELSEHDRLHIEDSIASAWEELEHIDGKFQSYHIDSISELEQWIKVECDNSSFNQIYFVAADGTIYTDGLLADGGEETVGSVELLPYFQQGKDRIVTWFEDPVDQESILYGIRLENFTVGEIQMVGVAGITDMDAVKSKLVVSSFVKNGQSRGHSAVIDLDGNYIINNRQSEEGQIRDNFFNRMEQGKNCGMDWETVSAKMQTDESFVFTYVTESGKKEYVYCEPFVEQDIPWYFILVVDNSLFEDENSTFLLMNITMLLCLILAVAILLHVNLTSRHEALAANAQAEARSAFLANMSHEIRTPLNGIIGLIYLINRDIDDDCQRPAVKQRLSKMQETADYLLSIINNILDLSKLKSGKVALNQEPVSPEQMADDIYAMQKNNIEERGIAFVLEKDLPIPQIIGDEILIKRVLMNIVGNAAKFTPKGGTIRLSVTQELHEQRVDTIFTCEDSGCGMSEEFLTHIWDSFSQERNKNSDSVKGTGLGMAISKLLVDAMGGDIRVQSELDVGSTFVVTLPSSVIPAQDKQPEPEENFPEADAADHKLRVLLAEDNDLNAEILLEVLRAEGHEGVHASDGQAAVQCFAESEEGEFDLILMDMQMPVMDGCEAAERIRSLNRREAKTIPIFACTANSFKEDRIRAYKSGMTDFLTKPIDVNVLLQKLGGVKPTGMKQDA